MIGESHGLGKGELARPLDGFQASTQGLVSDESTILFQAYRDNVCHDNASKIVINTEACFKNCNMLLDQCLKPRIPWEGFWKADQNIPHVWRSIVWHRICGHEDGRICGVHDDVINQSGVATNMKSRVMPFIHSLCSFTLFGPHFSCALRHCVLLHIVVYYTILMHQ